MRILKRVLPVVAAAVFAVSCAVNPASVEQTDVAVDAKAINANGLKVVGYMPSWQGDVNAIQYNKLTHINYSFALPNANGTLQPIENPAKLQSLVSLAHANGVKVLIAVGGWLNGDPSAFRSIANNGYSQAFANNVMAFINQYGLDGVDIDWEYPQPSDNFTGMMQVLYNTVHAQGKLVSAAVAPTDWGGSGVPGSSFAYMDYVNLMGYDGGAGAAHSPYSLAQQTIAYWQGKGLPKAKTILGVPFYGHDAANNSATYAAIVAADASAPNKDLSGAWYYNGIATIKAKTALAMQSAGGVMIWELSQDATGSASLLSAIAEQITSSSSSSTSSTSTSSSSSSGGGTTVTVPATIEAEKYSTMSGVQVEACSEGGQNVAYIDANDWMVYPIKVNTAGQYKIEYRVASVSGATLSADLNAGATQLGSVTIPATGGWQTWTTVSHTVTLPAGTMNMGIFAKTGGWNINNIKVSSVGSFNLRVEAESFSAMSGIQTEACTEGGQNVGYIDAGDWMVFPVSVPSAGTYTIKYRVASVSGAKLSSDLNGGATQLGQVTIPATGGWQTWTTVTQTVSLPAGSFNFGIYAPAAGWNINWFEITK